MNKISFFANNQRYIPTGTSTYRAELIALNSKNEYMKISSLKL